VNKVMLLAIASGVVALASGTALAGPPGWCKDAPTNAPRMNDLGAKDPETVIKGLVAAECNPNEESEAHRADIEKAREAWGKRLGMSEGDWSDAVAWLNHTEPKIDFSTKKFVEMTPIDQWFAIGKANKVTDNSQGSMDGFYVADIFDAKLSEVGRLRIVSECLGEDEPILWASCQDDIDKLDYNRLFDQLRADANHSGEIRMKIRMTAYGMPARVKKHAEKVAKLQAEDPAWKKAFDIAAKARTEWAALATKNAKFLAITAEMESAALAKSRSMFEGCDEKTYAALGEAMSAIPAKTFAKMHDVRDDPFKGFADSALPVAMKNPAVNVAAIGVVLCGKRDGLVYELGGALSSSASLRGPRNFAISKMAEASLQLDDTSKEISWPTMHHPYPIGADLASAGAHIKSIKKHEDHLTVESSPMMVTTEDCVAEHVGKHIERVRDDGQVVYERICDKLAMRKHDVSWTPFEINARYEKILKVGQVFSTTYGPHDSDLIAVWASPTATAPMWMLGGYLK